MQTAQVQKAGGHIGGGEFSENFQLALLLIDAAPGDLQCIHGLRKNGTQHGADKVSRSSLSRTSSSLAAEPLWMFPVSLVVVRSAHARFVLSRRCQGEEARIMPGKPIKS